MSADFPLSACEPGACRREKTHAVFPCEGTCVWLVNMRRDRRAFNRDVIRRVRDAGLASSLSTARAYVLAHGGYEHVASELPPLVAPPPSGPGRHSPPYERSGARGGVSSLSPAFVSVTEDEPRVNLLRPCTTRGWRESNK